MEVDALDRLIPLDGAFNFRDLGGYPGAGGRVTRWRTLFRSDTLHELSPADIATLRAMGLATVVDLRTPRELERTGRGPLEPEAVDYRHLPVIRETTGGEAAGEAMAAPANDDDLSARYLWYLEVGSAALAEALAILGNRPATPWSSTARPARIGPACWQPGLDLLGVDPAVIVADYLITADRMDLILGRYRSDPAFEARMAQTPPSRFSVEGPTMEHFLDVLHRQFGGAEGWASTVGVSSEAIEGIRAALLEPPGRP